MWFYVHVSSVPSVAGLAGERQQHLRLAVHPEKSEKQVGQLSQLSYAPARPATLGTLLRQLSYAPEV